MVRYCSYPGCLSRSSKNPGVSFHKFPSDEFRRQTWLTAAGVRNWNPSQFSHLCSFHFKPGDFKPHLVKGKHLWGSAVPSVFRSHALSEQFHQEHLPERPHMITSGSNSVSRQRTERNRGSLKNDSSSYFDPSLFMKATMGVEQNELDIVALSSKIPHKQHYWKPDISRQFSLSTDWQVRDKQRKLAFASSARQMSFATNNLQIQDQPTCAQAPSAQVQPLNMSKIPDQSANVHRLSSAHLEMIMLEKIITIIEDIERKNVQQNVSLNFALRWIRALQAKMKPTSTTC